jgi:endonuclease/exonuclease/phosphatase family metal-dependent hydrolase
LTYEAVPKLQLLDKLKYQFENSTGGFILKGMKKILAPVGMAAGILIALAILGVAALFACLTAAEYRPADTETLDIRGPAGSLPGLEVPFTILSWNIGYASLDAGQDFFMDGGRGVRPRTGGPVRENLEGIKNFIASRNDDIILIQEADIRSRRSYYIDEAAALAGVFPGSSAFAHNFLCRFVPFPFPEFIGEVSSGLLTLNTFRVDQAIRISLPSPFSWPVRIANLKRCLLAERIPVNSDGGGDRELVLVNLHLEAYDSGGGREAQTRALMEFLYREYEKGNYCVAGGDFNQTFPGFDENRFPIRNRDYFVPGALSPSLLKPSWRFAADLETPSARLLNKPYSGSPGDTQFYIIDGFILSPNIELLSVQTMDLNFRYSDHNPVEIKVMLKVPGET